MEVVGLRALFPTGEVSVVWDPEMVLKAVLDERGPLGVGQRSPAWGEREREGEAGERALWERSVRILCMNRCNIFCQMNVWV